MKKNTFTIRQAKEIDMISFLATLGIEPVKILPNDSWYICPFQGERTASFKVNRRRNQWYHFGLGMGGDLIDFGRMYYQCNISDLLAKLGKSNAVPFISQNKYSIGNDEKLIVVTDHKPLAAPALIDYLSSRNIPLDIANIYCSEVQYSLHQRNYYAIGFANNSGGYEIRNAHVKLSSSPKDLTSLLNGYPSVAVFEGFMDFLSYLVIAQKPSDYIILNSSVFLKKALPILAPYNEKLLFMDNDHTGDRCTAEAISYAPGGVDCRHLYKQFQDLNDWLRAEPLTRLPYPRHL